MKNDLKTAYKSYRKHGNILNVRIDSTYMNEVLRGVSEFLSKKQKFSIFTPNPEIVLGASRDKDFLNILNSGTINIPDGTGLNYAFRFLYGKHLNIIPGRKVFESLIDMSSKKGWKVFLLGGLKDEAEKTAKKLGKKYSNLKIDFFSGPILNKKAESVSERDVAIEIDSVNKINQFKPDILFVGFGAPKQEMWIHKWLPRLNIGGAMAVGGTFSYFSGNVKLPPSWMEKLSLEWLWRMIKEPRRLGRIINAIVVFPMKVFLSKFH